MLWLSRLWHKVRNELVGDGSVPNIPVEIPPPPCRNPRGTWFGPPTTDPPELGQQVRSILAVANKVDRDGDSITDEALKEAWRKFRATQPTPGQPVRPPDVKDIPPEDMPAPPAESCLDDTLPPKTHKAAMCHVSLDMIARLLRLPPGVEVMGIHEELTSEGRKHGYGILILEGPGLPERCCVDITGPLHTLATVDPKLKVDREGNVEFGGWE